MALTHLIMCHIYAWPKIANKDNQNHMQIKLYPNFIEDKLNYSIFGSYPNLERS